MLIQVLYLGRVLLCSCMGSQLQEIHIHLLGQQHRARTLAMSCTLLWTSCVQVRCAFFTKSWQRRLWLALLCH